MDVIGYNREFGARVVLAGRNPVVKIDLDWLMIVPMVWVSILIL